MKVNSGTVLLHTSPYISIHLHTLNHSSAQEGDPSISTSRDPIIVRCWCLIVVLKYKKVLFIFSFFLFLLWKERNNKNIHAILNNLCSFLYFSFFNRLYAIEQTLVQARIENMLLIVMKQIVLDSACSYCEHVYSSPSISISSSFLEGLA